LHDDRHIDLGATNGSGTDFQNFRIRILRFIDEITGVRLTEF
jgi:hypothetical protein